MARVDVRIDDFEDGALPPVCVTSGAEADRLYRVDAEHKPRWPVAFVLLGPMGLVVAIVVGAFATRRVSGLLPYELAAHHQLEAIRRRHWRNAVAVLAAAAIVALVLLVAGLGYAGAVALVAGGIVAAPLYVAGARPRGSVGVRLAANGRTVVLTGASDAFARRYERQEGERLAERQGATRPVTS